MCLSKHKHYHGSMPSILNELLKEGLSFNNSNARKDIYPSKRCIAFALNGSRLITFGYNIMKTHPFTKQYHDQLKLSRHAEADLVMKLNKMNMINKVTDIVIIRGCSKPLNSYPCDICYGLIKMYFSCVRMWYYDENNKKWKVEMI